MASADRVFEFIDKSKRDEEDKGKEIIGTLKNSIAFENVSFAYENENVLNNISFKIKNKPRRRAGSLNNTVTEFITEFSIC